MPNILLNVTYHGWVMSEWPNEEQTGFHIAILRNSIYASMSHNNNNDDKIMKKKEFDWHAMVVHQWMHYIIMLTRTAGTRHQALHDKFQNDQHEYLKCRICCF